MTNKTELSISFSYKWNNPRKICHNAIVWNE